MSDKTNKNLKEAGLKATLPRIKILEILQRTSGTDDHFTAEDIYKELINIINEQNLQTDVVIVPGPGEINQSRDFDAKLVMNQESESGGP